MLATGQTWHEVCSDLADLAELGLLDVPYIGDDNQPLVHYSLAQPIECCNAKPSFSHYGTTITDRCNQLAGHTGCHVSTTRSGLTGWHYEQRGK